MNNNSNMPLAFIVAAALLGLNQEQAAAHASDFTPLESLSAPERIAIQTRFEFEHPSQSFNWEQSIVGVNANGEIEVRDKNSFELQAVGAPTCAD